MNRRLSSRSFVLIRTTGDATSSGISNSHVLSVRGTVPETSNARETATFAGAFFPSFQFGFQAD